MNFLFTALFSLNNLALPSLLLPLFSVPLDPTSRLIEWYLLGDLLHLDPTIKQAHINLGHFKTEQLQRGTHSHRSAKDAVNNKKKRKNDSMFTYERLCRGESRKVGDLTC